MKTSTRKNLALFYLIPGIAGAALYRAIYALAMDARELVVRGSVFEILLWILTAAAVAGAAVIGTKVRLSTDGKVPFLGCLVYAFGIFTLTLSGAQGPAPLVLAYRVVTWAAAAGMVVTAVLRILGKKQPFLLSLLPCLLCLLHLVECYQLWSEVPQVTDYVFGVGAILCAALFAYHNMAAPAGLPAGKLYSFSGYAGVFFCLVAAVGSDFNLYFLCTAVWMLSILLTARTEA